MYNKQVLIYGAIALAGCILQIILNWDAFKSAFRRAPKEVDVADEEDDHMATFDIHNHENTPLLIRAESDGEVFILPSGGVAQVNYYSLGKGVALTFSMTEAGMRQVTLLDDGGGYWVEYNHETVL